MSNADDVDRPDAISFDDNRPGKFPGRRRFSGRVVRRWRDGRRGEIAGGIGQVYHTMGDDGGFVGGLR